MSEQTKKVFAPLFLTVILIACLCGCQNLKKTEDESSYIFTMGTVFQVRVISKDTQEDITAASAVLNNCNDLISWRIEDSIPDRFNQSHNEDVSEIADMIEVMLQVAEDSDGAFDPTVLPLSELWQFDKMAESDFDISLMTVPDAELIEAALKNVDYTLLSYNKEEQILSTEDEDLLIELGALGKGYGIDLAVDALRQQGAQGGMISAGSSIKVFGEKADGKDFVVAVRDPRGDGDQYIGLLTLKDTSISTSGDYERYFEVDGIRYHHIIDPKTGYPADSGLMQVTIITESCMLGDALSTACFVLGLEEGMALARQYGVMAIFVDTDRNVWYNDAGVLDLLQFTGTSEGYQLVEYN